MTITTTHTDPDAQAREDAADAQAREDAAYKAAFNAARKAALARHLLPAEVERLALAAAAAAAAATR